jgi:plasmid stabilization system protein ParE
MNYIFNWDLIAIETYIEESEFILLKWNYKEVENFKILVDQNLVRLSKNPEIGTFDKNNKVYFLVISKQTTLYYSFNAEIKVIALHVFWNNLKNPEDLNKLL